jgi:hypothetical protein
LRPGDLKTIGSPVSFGDFDLRLFFGGSLSPLVEGADRLAASDTLLAYDASVRGEIGVYVRPP